MRRSRVARTLMPRARAAVHETPGRVPDELLAKGKAHDTAPREGVVALESYAQLARLGHERDEVGGVHALQIAVWSSRRSSSSRLGMPC
jgi:hypothetical protein